MTAPARRSGSLHRLLFWKSKSRKCLGKIDAIIRNSAMTAGGNLRYLAEAEPEKIWQQLPLEQVPMKGAP
jgi:hypothetical protein